MCDKYGKWGLIHHYQRQSEVRQLLRPTKNHLHSASSRLCNYLLEVSYLPGVNGRGGVWAWQEVTAASRWPLCPATSSSHYTKTLTWKGKQGLESNSIKPSTQNLKGLHLLRRSSSFFFFFLLIYSIRWVPFCNLHKDSFFVQRGPGHMLSAFFPPSLSFHLLQRGLNLPPWYRKGWSSSFPKVCTVLKNFKFIALSVGGLLLKFEMFALYHI